ncbi:class I SAM-dependent methyltransferase [bacterium]|nr:class I SAM-dependent methyltransferase [bacterium]
MTSTINNALWSQYRAFSHHRGRLAAEWLAQHLSLNNAEIADLGCGTGGASLQLARCGCRITAVDIRSEALQLLETQARQEDLPISIHCQDVLEWRARQPLDAILMWDVLEHVADPERLLAQCSRSLKETGLICFSTPNKWSPVHLLCDPHYSLPLISCMQRTTIKKIIVHGLHWVEADKPDIAQLLSWHDLHRMLEKAQLKSRWQIREVATLALAQPQAVWNRTWHLALVRRLCAWNFAGPLVARTPRAPGWLSQWLMPTFYVLACRK